MGIAKIPFDLHKFGLGSKGVDVKILASILLQLPEGTKFIGMELGTQNSLSALVFSHPFLKDGAELVGNYRRDIAVVDGQVHKIDHFIGLDLKDVLVMDIEKQLKKVLGEIESIQLVRCSREMSGGLFGPCIGPLKIECVIVTENYSTINAEIKLSEEDSVNLFEENE